VEFDVNAFSRITAKTSHNISRGRRNREYYRKNSEMIFNSYLVHIYFCISFITLLLYALCLSKHKHKHKNCIKIKMYKNDENEDIIVPYIIYIGIIFLLH